MIERLRRNALLRHGPVTALSILIAVCLTALTLIGQERVAVVAVTPLGAVLGLYFRQILSGNG